MRRLTNTVAAAACALPLAIGAGAGPPTQRQQALTGGAARIGHRYAGSRTILPSTGGSGARDVLALAGGIVWTLDSADQIVRSTDAGADWRARPPHLGTHADGPADNGRVLSQRQRRLGSDGPPVAGATGRHDRLAYDRRWGQLAAGPLAPGHADRLRLARRPACLRRHRARLRVSVSGNARHDMLWGTSDGGMNWRRLAAVGLPWQDSTVPIGRGPGCTAVGPFVLTAASASTLVLTDDLCPTKAPGIWRSDDAGRNWRPSNSHAQVEAGRLARAGSTQHRRCRRPAAPRCSQPGSSPE